MRKVAAVTLIMVLMGPWLGLFCACCTEAQASPVASAEISNAGCDCCPEPARIESTTPGILDFLTSLRALSFLRVVSPVLFNASLSGAGPSLSTRTVTDPGPPASDSEIPLYLSLENLRL